MKLYEVSVTWLLISCLNYYLHFQKSTLALYFNLLNVCSFKCSETEVIENHWKNIWHTSDNKHLLPFMYIFYFPYKENESSIEKLKSDPQDVVDIELLVIKIYGTFWEFWVCVHFKILKQKKRFYLLLRVQYIFAQFMKQLSKLLY